jgi:ABC-type transport system involved in multi-copper enzyme maturation permease subunit
MTENLQDQLVSGPGGTASPWLTREAPGPSVLWTIFRKEVRQVAGSFRFQACAVLLVGLMVLGAVTGGARYHSEVLVQSPVADGYAAEIPGVTVDRLTEILHPAVKPPWALTPVVDGGQESTPNVYSQALSAFIAPEIRRVHSGNERLPGREALDWMLVIRVVLPLSAFLLGYDAVCGERRRGTLSLLLSYPLPRWKVLASKLLALWSCLAAPFLAGAAVSLLIAAGPAKIPFQPGDWIKIELVGLLGLWAAALFALAALLASSWCRKPSTSLSVLAWLWVTGVIVVPALSGLLAHRLRPILTESEITSRMRAIDQKIAREYAGREGHWRQPMWAAADGFAWERVSAEAENRRSDAREEIRRQALQRKIGQARLAKSLAWLSPASLVDDLGERLTGSGLWRDASFLAQAQGFRQILAERVKALDASDPESPHILFFRGYVSKRPVPPGALARFTFRELPVREGLVTALPLLALLGAETLALAGAAVLVFSRLEAGRP